MANEIQNEEALNLAAEDIAIRAGLKMRRGRVLKTMVYYIASTHRDVDVIEFMMMPTDDGKWKIGGMAFLANIKNFNEMIGALNVVD